MSKQVRLELPLYHEGKPISKMWLSINGANVTAYTNENQEIDILDSDQKSCIKVCVPDETKKIRVFRPVSFMPVDYISATWFWFDSQCELRFPKLKKLSVVFDDTVHDIPVDNGTPDRADWVYYTEVSSEGTLLRSKKWALIIATLEDKTVGILYLSDSVE